MEIKYFRLEITPYTTIGDELLRKASINIRINEKVLHKDHVFTSDDFESYFEQYMKYTTHELQKAVKEMK